MATTTKFTVDIGIDTDEQKLSVQLISPEGDRFPMEIKDTATLMSELSAALEIVLSNTQNAIMNTTRKSTLPTPRRTRQQRIGWRRAATSDYVLEVPNKPKLEVKLEDPQNRGKGWVAMIGDEVIYRSLKDAKAAKTLILDTARENNLLDGVELK